MLLRTQTSSPALSPHHINSQGQGLVELDTLDLLL